MNPQTKIKSSTALLGILGGIVFFSLLTFASYLFGLASGIMFVFAIFLLITLVGLVYDGAIRGRVFGYDFSIIYIKNNPVSFFFTLVIEVIILLVGIFIFLSPILHSSQTANH